MPVDRSSGITIVDVVRQPNRLDLLREIYSSILIPSFRPDELDPLSVVEEALTEEPCSKDVLAAVDGENHVLGAAVGDWDEQSRVYLLSYLAARPGLRSQGVGTVLMDDIQQRWERRDALFAVAEVDDPRVYPVSDVGDPAARLRFYERFGARVVDVPYTQPRVRPGGSEVSGMLLLVFAIRAAALLTTSPPVLRSTILQSFMRGYVGSADGREAQDDGGSSTFRDRLSAPGVAVLPLSRYREIAVAS
jgi:GNAT superfamily N-acetyltransferase